MAKDDETAVALEYRRGAGTRPWRGDAYTLVLKALSAYLVVSVATLPFLDAIWIGELPVLALVQLPKIGLAERIRTGLVMPAIAALGMSSGSFSPDYLMARPYALAAAYLVALAPVLLLVAWRTRMARRHVRRWALILLAVAVVDFIATLSLAGGPGFSIYS